MNRIHILILSILSLMLSATLPAHADMDTSSKIFDPYFKTLKIYSPDNFMAPPVLRLGTNDRLIVSFDEIGEDNSYLEYRLIHCNADWQPSRLIESEYVDGFNSRKIEDYAYSSATFVHYVNYRIELPDPELPIIHSGNYLLQVYDPDADDKVLLQIRFQVSENSLNLTGGVTTRTDRGHYGEWQQLAFAADGSALGRFNPYQDIFVDITQNLRPSTSKRLLTPLRVDGSSMYYEHQPDLLFPASNEFRRFESTSTAFTGLHVDSMQYMGSNYHVWLKPDAPRVYSQYSYDRTQHGRFMVNEYNATDPDIGADYLTVHFRLETPEIRGMEVYVEGEFTNYDHNPSNRMTYNPQIRAYEAEIPIKQGSYNYQYVLRPADSDKAPSPEKIEGNKYETENEYNVSVYFRPPGARADRLVGSATLVSN